MVDKTSASKSCPTKGPEFKIIRLCLKRVHSPSTLGAPVMPFDPCSPNKQQTTEKNRFPNSNLSTGGPSTCSWLFLLVSLQDHATTVPRRFFHGARVESLVTGHSAGAWPRAGPGPDVPAAWLRWWKPSDHLSHLLKTDSGR